MSILPEKPISEIILSKLTHSKISEHRGHIGYSSAGEECKRKFWYDLHWAYDKIVDDRLQRIFDTGFIAEDFMECSLLNAGYIIHSKQLEIIGCYGHVLGHIDGIVTIDNIDYLIEFKTMNDSNFVKLKKEGCKKSKRVYYYQMQAYMGKLNISNGILMVYNKNTSEYYLEVIKANKFVFEEIESMMFDVLTSEFIPDKIGEKTWFACKFCNAKSVCQDSKSVSINCRTCEYVDIENDGKWSCSLKSEVLNIEQQRIGCNSWIIKGALK